MREGSQKKGQKVRRQQPHQKVLQETGVEGELQGWSKRQEPSPPMTPPTPLFRDRNVSPHNYKLTKRRDKHINPQDSEERD